MKTIPLTRGFVAMVDDEDYPSLSRFKWYALLSKRTDLVYAVRNVSRKLTNGKHVGEMMHRKLLGLPKAYRRPR